MLEQTAKSNHVTQDLPGRLGPSFPSYALLEGTSRRAFNRFKSKSHCRTRKETSRALVIWEFR